MQFPLAAIRGGAVTAALAVGSIAGTPTASAHRAPKTGRVEHVHRSSTHRRTRHRRRPGRRRAHCRLATRARLRAGCRRRLRGARVHCRLRAHVKHGSICRRRIAGTVHRKRRHRHPRPVTQPPASPPATQAAPPTPAPAPPAPAPAPAAAPAPPVQPAGVSGNWQLVFDDEFNGSAIDTGVWNEHDGWVRQNNVTDHAANVTEQGGVATLTLASSGSGATIATNQAVLAVGDFAEARVDFAGSGTTIYDWPAWWASGPDWPAAGENDIAEGLGTLTVNYHSPSGTHNEGTVAGDWAGAFHTYGIYRGAGYCEVYWDGQLVRRYSTDDNGGAQQLLFTSGAANTLAFGAAGQMQVDYVRTWAPG